MGYRCKHLGQEDVASPWKVVTAEQDGQLTTIDKALSKVETTREATRSLADHYCHGEYAANHEPRRPNDCRINCKTASHGDGDRGTPLAPYCRMDPQAACRRRSWIVLAGR